MKSTIISFIIASVSYYIAGRFGLILAIPPGFASAVWPASGIALACAILMRTPAAIIGVGVGSFVINFGVGTQNFSHITALASLVALFISLGAVCQTYVGYLLWQKLIPKNIPDSPQYISRFLFIVAPLGCLVAATVGVLALLGGGIVPLSNIDFTWLTWWVGDVIGVILFTPLCITFFSLPKSSSISRKIQIITPTLLVFFGVLVLFFLSTQYNYRTINDEIDIDGNNLATKIKEQLAISEGKLLAFSAYYRVKKDVSRSEFDGLAELLLDNSGVLQAIGWSPVVPHSKRHTLETDIQNEGFDNFTITEFIDSKIVPASTRLVYYPVINIYPFQPNRAAFGLNLGANAERLLALVMASKTGRAVSTAPIVLAQNKNNEKSIIVYFPIYEIENEKSSTHVYDRSEVEKESIRGFIGGVYSVENILGNILNEAYIKNYSVSITDITDVNNPKLFISTPMLPKAKFKEVRTLFSFAQRHYELISYANTNYKILTKDWTSWAILTLGFLLAGMLQAFLLMLTGTTQRIQAEVQTKTKEFLEAKQSAEEASKAKSNFLANMSHEFRTPLNAILGFTNLCLKTELNEKQTMFLNKVKLASDTLMSLITHTLDYAKIESHNIHLEQIEIPFDYIIKKIDAIFVYQAQEKGVRFFIDVPDFSDVYVMGDPLRVEQVLLNLCSNALKFTESGNVALTIDFKQCEEKGYTTVEFIVKDTGIGISKEKQHLIFDAFQQADDDISRKYGGSGLGLAITKQLISLMNGTLTFKSELGVGSEFIVQIPLKILSPLPNFLVKELDS